MNYLVKALFMNLTEKATSYPTVSEEADDVTHATDVAVELF